MLDRERFQTLLLNVLDGAEVDWKSAEAATASEEEQRLLHSLRLISAVAAAHRERPLDSDPGGSSRFEGLELLEPIGDGAFGTVYRARDTRLDRDVAVKIIRSGGAVASDVRILRERLLEEARRLARVRHPNVVTIHSVEVLEEDAAIVMELIGGQTLAGWIRERDRLEPGEICAVGRDLCRALAEVHAAGLAHMDLKPQNVMREETGRIVLMDFGARGATPATMAPELFAGHPPSPAADVYGLGALLYFLSTGAYPYPGGTYEEVRHAQEAGHLTPITLLRRGFPEPLEQVIDRALEHDISRRYTSVREMEQALAGASAAVERGRVRGRNILLSAAIGVAATVALVMIFRMVSTQTAVPREASGVTAPSTRAPEIAAAVLPSDLSTLEVNADLFRGALQREKLSNGMPVSVGDSLSIRFAGSESLYVYVVNQDDAGQAYLLFPIPGMKPANPLPPGAHSILPGTRKGRSFYWQVTSAGGREHFLILASRRRLRGLEADLLAVSRAAVGRELRYPQLGDDALDELRGVGGLVGGPEPSKGSDVVHQVFELGDSAGESPAKGQDIWVRRIDLVSR